MVLNLLLISMDVGRSENLEVSGGQKSVATYTPPLSKLAVMYLFAYYSKILSGLRKPLIGYSKGKSYNSSISNLLVYHKFQYRVHISKIFNYEKYM